MTYKLQKKWSIPVPIKVKVIPAHPCDKYQLWSSLYTFHCQLYNRLGTSIFSRNSALHWRVSPSTMNDKCTHNVKLWTADKSKHCSLNCVIAITHICPYRVIWGVIPIKSPQVVWVSQWVPMAVAMIGPGLQHWYFIKSALVISQHTHFFWYSVLKENDKMFSQYIVLLWNLIDKYKKYH